MRHLRSRNPLFPVRTAAYLRCYPYDSMQTGPHYWRVLQHARDLHLPMPDVYFDNGILASRPLPHLRRLLDVIATERYDVLLLPGPFVLSLDAAEAGRLIRWISDHGCQVEELPPRTPRPRHPAMGEDDRKAGEEITGRGGGAVVPMG